MRICLYTNTALPKVGRTGNRRRRPGPAVSRPGARAGGAGPLAGSQGPFDAASVPYPVVWHPRFFSTHWFVSWYGRWMAKLHHAHGFDVIHCHGTYPAGYVGACCQAVRHLPLVITSHGDDLAPLGLYDRKPELRERYRLALEQADAAVAISDYTAEMFREACPELRRIVPIPNGVEVEQFAAPVPRPGEYRRLDPPEILSALPGPARSAERDRRAAGGDGLAPRPMRSRSGRGRTGTGRPGAGSPGRAARSCPASPFRRPDGRPAETVAAAKRPVHDRSFANLGGLWRRGDGEPCRRTAGDCLAACRALPTSSSPGGPGCSCRRSRRERLAEAIRADAPGSASAPTTGAKRPGDSFRPSTGETSPSGTGLVRRVDRDQASSRPTPRGLIGAHCAAGHLATHFLACPGCERKRLSCTRQN